MARPSSSSARLAVVAALLVRGCRSIPDYDATIEVAGISAPVEIVRDNANVPHIFGATDPDVYFALGFAHAQDRLWQMMTLRRTAQGRLSELFGVRARPDRRPSRARWISTALPAVGGGAGRARTWPR